MLGENKIMKSLTRFLVAAWLCLVFCGLAQAQWQVPSHAVPTGRGVGVQGFNSVSPVTAGRLLIDQGANSDPVFQILSGGCSLAGSGAISCTAGSLTGTLNAAQFPALTGDISTSTGSLVTNLTPGASIKNLGTAISPIASGNSTTCNGASDDSAALSAASASAVAAGVPLIIGSTCKIGTNLSLAANIQFLSGGNFQVANTFTATLSGQISAPWTQQIFSGAGSVATSNAAIRSVAWWGALVAADAGPALRASLASNSFIIVPPGTYTVCSTQTSPYADIGPPLWLIQSLTNTTLDLRGATIAMCNGLAGSGAGDLLISKNTNFKMLGGVFPGNTIAVGITLFNNVGFEIDGQTFTGDWSGGAAFDGDYNVNGTISNIQAQNVTSCFDFAFLLNVSIENVFATGKNGASAGDKCFSNIIDPPSVGYNTTGFTINDSSYVSLSGFNVSNFNNGYAIASGTNWILTNNFWHNNVGSAGGLWYYNNGGTFTSVGHPASNVVISGDRYDTNGVNGGIEIDSNAISNSDVFSNFQVSAAFLNNTSYGIEATSVSHISNVSSVDALCSGASQTSCLGTNISSIVSPSSNIVFGSGVALTSSTTANVTSISLPPGVWDVTGNVGANGAATTVVTQLQGSINTTSAVLPGTTQEGYVISNGFSATASLTSINLGTVRFNLAATTTIYLNVNASFSTSTCKGYGAIRARRVK